MLFEWKNPRTDGYPETRRMCFIDVSGYMDIAYWRPEIQEWSNPISGRLPKVYDDEGEYPPEVLRWTYIPDNFFG